MSLRRFPVLLTALLLPSAVLAAAIFPDVPDGHLFQSEIESLVRAGVVHGNPDGTFSPDRTVNRAEVLKMLYLASGRVPGEERNCFSDVAAGSWYESYVCDAAERRFVQGYGDGRFRPEQQVNRVEALKMLFEILELPAPDISAEDRNLIQFVDVSVAAWYTKYVSAAFQLGILPVAGQSGSRFGPEQPLTRGEAAAYISGAVSLDLHLQRNQQTGDSSSSSSDSSSSRSDASAHDDEEDEGFVVKQVTFPFTDAGTFDGRTSAAYAFTLTEQRTVLSVRAKGTGALPSGPECRLYLFEENGFTERYFLGVREGNDCVATIATGPGNYQLELQPTVADAHYDLSVTSATGDGSDGFIEASLLPLNASRTGVLSPHDTHDWYRFVVTEERRGFLETSSSAPLNCVIYTPLSIDQFGFSGPACNEYYEYAPGTYYVSLGHTPPLAKQQTYTVKFR